MFNQLHNEIRKYFGISRTETNGIFFLIIITICVILSPLLYRNLFREGYTSYVSDSLKLDSCLQILIKNKDSLKTFADLKRPEKDTLFVFDPNKVSYRQMIVLGIDPNIAQRILNYRKHNGLFRVKKDLLKIYGFPESLYHRLAGFIFLADTIPKMKKLYAYNRNPSEVDTGYSVQKVPVMMDINRADTNDLKRIRGIGSILSGRIVKYRDLLGGYANIDQLDDVYGLNGSSLENIKAMAYVDSLFMPAKIRINFSEWEELVRHPYFSSKMANDILKLRSERGFLKNAKVLKELPDLNDSIFNRILPYLEF